MTPAQRTGESIYLEFYETLKDYIADPKEAAQRLAIKCVDRMRDNQKFTADSGTLAKYQILNMS